MPYWSQPYLLFCRFLSSCIWWFSFVTFALNLRVQVWSGRVTRHNSAGPPDNSGQQQVNSASINHPTEARTHHVVKNLFFKVALLNLLNGHMCPQSVWEVSTETLSPVLMGSGRVSSKSFQQFPGYKRGDHWTLPKVTEWRFYVVVFCPKWWSRFWDTSINQENKFVWFSGAPGERLNMVKVVIGLIHVKGEFTAVYWGCDDWRNTGFCMFTPPRYHHHQGGDQTRLFQRDVTKYGTERVRKYQINFKTVM